MTTPSKLPRTLFLASLVAAAALAAPPADAHFRLETPASWMSQDVLGSPQKLGPCGDEPGGTPTGTVTAYKPGDTVTITIDEKIYHPGHYRVALSVNDRSELPPEPVVTPDSKSPCGSAAIQSPAAFPVLADGVLAHTSPFSGPQTIQVKLPTNVTCDHCTIQVLEFMSNHALNNPGGCYYHHCADISISGPAPNDAGTGGTGTTTTSTTSTTTTPSTTTTNTGAGGQQGSGGNGGAGGEGEESSGGCGCSVPGGASPAISGLVSLFALSMLLRRRKRGTASVPWTR
jgi:MYXO-CTERM domain-containing protein